MTDPRPSPELTPARLAEIRISHVQRVDLWRHEVRDLLDEIDRLREQNERFGWHGLYDLAQERLRQIEELTAENRTAAEALAALRDQAQGSWTNGVRHGRELASAEVAKLEADNERLRSALEGKVWEPTLEAALRTYGNHHTGCTSLTFQDSGRCSCGLGDVLDAIYIDDEPYRRLSPQEPTNG